MDSSDEDEDKDHIRWRLRYSRWSIGKDDDDAGAYKAALGRVGRRAKDSVESQDGGGGRVDVCSLRGTTSTRNYHPANHTRGSLKTFSHISFQCPPLSNHLFRITFVHRYQRTRTSSIVTSIRRFGKILGGRVRYLRRLSVFNVLDGEQDVNVCLVLCQRGVWGRANLTSIGITTEY